MNARRSFLSATVGLVFSSLFGLFKRRPQAETPCSTEFMFECTIRNLSDIDEKKLRSCSGEDCVICYCPRYPRGSHFSIEFKDT